MKPNTFHLQMHVTERCNLKCRHCYQDGKYLKNELGVEQLTEFIIQFIDLLDKFKITPDNARLSLTGGEPLVRNDFFQLLKKCRENRNHFKYEIMSNGCLINEVVAKRLKKLGIAGVQVSLEGLRETNDFIRSNGTFDKICDAIKILIDEGIRVSVSMTVTKHNLEDVLGMMNLCRDLHVNRVSLRRLVPCGSGSNLEMLSPLELRNLYKLVAKASKEKGLRIVTGCENSLWTIDDMNFITHGCSSAYDSLTILPNGDVFPCRRLPIKVGNATKQTLLEIYNSPLMGDLRNKNNMACKNCSNFDKCRGGARCIAYGYFNSYFAPDPQCWLAFDELPRFKYIGRQID